MSSSKTSSKSMQQPLSPSTEREWDTAQHEGERASQKVQDAAHKVQDAAQNVQEMASHGVSAVGQSADDMTENAGAGIRQMGDRLRQQSPDRGVMGHASQAAGEILHDSGEYIEHAKLSGMAEDVTQIIKDHPVPAVLVGIGLGVLLGRCTRS